MGLRFRPRTVAIVLALLVTGLVATPSLAQGGDDDGSKEADWSMEGCHGLATLALADRDAVDASVPDGYEAESAADFLIPGSVDARDLLGDDAQEDKGYVGMEIWKCDRIRLGSVEVEDAVYGSTAAVIEAPEGAPDADLYFYKYENFFSDRALVAQSERLGAPARLVADADVDETATGARGSLQLADGGRYELTTVDLGSMDDGNFEEWHEPDKGTSHWFAAFTTDPGQQGTGTLDAPGGSTVADVMGDDEGDGLGIHTRSTFNGGVELDRD